MRDFGMGKVGAEKNIQYESEIVMERYKSHRGRAFDPSVVINMAVSNITCTIAFGERFDYEDTEFKSVLDSINESFRTQSHPASRFLLMSGFCKYIAPGFLKKFQMLHEVQAAFVRKILEEHKKRYDGTVNDLIDAYFKEMETEKKGSVFCGKFSI